MPNLQRAEYSSLRFNKAAQRYVAPNGQFIKPEAVRRVIDGDIEATSRRMQSHGAKLQNAARALQDGKISQAEYSQAVNEFGAAMRSEVKYLHLAEVCAAKGGIASMDQAAFGFAGQRLQFHYSALDQWIAELETSPELATNEATGRLPFERRIAAYAQAGRSTYEWMREKEHVANGFLYYENELESEHPCTGSRGCAAQTAKGRVRVGALLRIGERSCATECKCRLSYFRTAALS